ncbi:hypothetical protein D3C86_2264070 [compost metagenome]
MRLESSGLEGQAVPKAIDQAFMEDLLLGVLIMKHDKQVPSQLKKRPHSRTGPALEHAVDSLGPLCA